MSVSRPSTPTTQPPSGRPAHPAQTLLTRAHSPLTSSTLYTSKFQHKPLLLAPTGGPSTGTNARSLRRHIRLRKKDYFLRHQKPRPLSAKEKRQSGVHDLKPEECRWDVYKGLNKLWEGYMAEVLGLTPTTGGQAKEGNARAGQTKNAQQPKQAQQQQTKEAQRKKDAVSMTAQNHGSLLASADFHGAILEVVRSKDVNKVGIRGVVVRDTKFTFVLVTPRDEVKVVPKVGSVFRYGIRVPSVDDRDVAEGGKDVLEGGKDILESGDRSGERKVVLELYGSQFLRRPAERAGKAFKWQMDKAYL